MKRLYRGAEQSPLLHPIDVRGWLAAGWSETPPIQQPVPTPKPPTTPQPESSTITPDREQRESELTSMGWEDVRDLFEETYALGDYKNKGAAIAAILAHEFEG